MSDPAGAPPAPDCDELLALLLTATERLLRVGLKLRRGTLPSSVDTFNARLLALNELTYALEHLEFTVPLDMRALANDLLSHRLAHLHRRAQSLPLTNSSPSSGS